MARARILRTVPVVVAGLVAVAAVMGEPARVPTGPVTGLPARLGIAEGVKDPLFGMLVWLCDTDKYGTLTQERMTSELKLRSGGTRIPYAWIESVTRLPVEPGRTAKVRLELTGEMEVDLPYSILGYNPGKVLASPVCVFKEWDLGDLSFDFKGEGQVVLEDVHLFGIEEGSVVVDVDAWLDWFLGKKLDDTDVKFLMLGRHEGSWVGFGMGYSTREARQGRSGVMDFVNDRIRFPTPRHLGGIAVAMRAHGEHLTGKWTEPVAGPTRGSRF